MPKLAAHESLIKFTKQAKELLTALRQAAPEAFARAQVSHPRWQGQELSRIECAEWILQDAQAILAHEHGQPTWAKFRATLLDGLACDAAKIEAFKRVVAAGDANGLRSLLAAEPELCVCIDEPLFAFDAPAIVAAANGGHRDLIDALIEAGADIDARSHWWAGSFGALDNAAPEIAEFLIGRGAYVDIHAAAGLGKVERVRELLDREPELVNARGGDGGTPIHFARGREVVALLIARGADLTIRDIDHGSTPAQWAVKDPEKLRLLIESGSPIDVFMAVALDDRDLADRALREDPACLSYRIGMEPLVSPDSSGGHIYNYKWLPGESALGLAKHFGRERLLAHFLAKATPAQRLVFAASHGDVEQVRQLVATDRRLVSQLHPCDVAALGSAAEWNDGPAVQRMVDLGFPVDAPGVEAMTALHRACLNGCPEPVRILLVAGADPALRHVYGGDAVGTCLWGSKNRTGGEHGACLRLLLDAGASVPVQPDASEACLEVIRNRLSGP